MYGAAESSRRKPGSGRQRSFQKQAEDPGTDLRTRNIEWLGLPESDSIAPRSEHHAIPRLLQDAMDRSIQLRLAIIDTHHNGNAR